MKKQVKKLAKKILIYGLATSIIFTSCFSYKKMEVKAMGAVVAALSAATLYDICLYVGGTAAVALGIGAVYNNRDEIAEFGKNFIDTMSDASQLGWAIGSLGLEGSKVYAGDVFNSIKENGWDYIKEGGSYAHIGQDLTGDGVIDIADREFEIASSNYWTTAEGAEYIYSQVQSVYDSWVNKEEDNILDAQYGAVDALYFDGVLNKNTDGLYYGNLYLPGYHFYIESAAPFCARMIYQPAEPDDYAYKYEALIYADKTAKASLYINDVAQGTIRTYNINGYLNLHANVVRHLNGDIPILSSQSAVDDFLAGNSYSDVLNYRKSYQVADWLDAQRTWTESINELTTTLRSLQDVCDIAMEACSVAVEIAPTVAGYKDLVADLADTFPVCLDTVANPVYWPETAPWEKIKEEDLPNSIVIDTPVGGGGEENEEDDNQDKEIDLNGLPSIFNIIFYFIMIVIMLIYLFLACLAFIVMIFRIPASSSMLPEEMVMGFEHLKTIMIPGMNISIYGFAMALIYLFIVFAVIKLIRLEINHFKMPRSYK